MVALRTPLRSVEGNGKLLKSGLPEISVTADPVIQLAEGLWAKRIQAFRPSGSDLDEACLAQDAQVPRDARLMDADKGHDVIDGLLVVTEQLHDSPPSGIRQSLEDVDLHTSTYTQ